MLRRLSSSCRQFRGQHVDFVDGFLDAETMRARDAHLMVCANCQRYDTQIRRSLLVLQALPEITPSPDFQRRLAERLAHESVSRPQTPSHQVRWGIAAVMMAASVAMLIAAPRLVPSPRSHAMPLVQAPSLLTPRATAPLTGPLATGLTGSLAVSTLAAESTTDANAPDATIRKAKKASDPRHSPRFEAVAGQSPLQASPYAPRSSAVRLQTVSAIGQ